MDLPGNDFDVDCINDEGEDAVSPGWEFKHLSTLRPSNIVAYRDSVVLTEDSSVDVVDADSMDMLELERDALAILAAIAQHRAWAEEDAR